MSKFKVGDRVKIVGHKPLDIYITENRVGDYGTVIRVGESAIGVSFSSKKDDWWWYDKSVIEHTTGPYPTRTITLSGTTYTLTPYEAPKLVTIDDVVYVMTEVK